LLHKMYVTHPVLVHKNVEEIVKFVGWESV